MTRILAWLGLRISSLVMQEVLYEKRLPVVAFWCPAGISGVRGTPPNYDQEWEALKVELLVGLKVYSHDLGISKIKEKFYFTLDLDGV